VSETPEERAKRIAETLTNEDRETLSLVALRKGQRFLELALGLPSETIEKAIHGQPCAEVESIKRWLDERAQRVRVHDCHLSKPHEITKVSEKQYTCKHCDGTP
jgi:hypothetical protein